MQAFIQDYLFLFLGILLAGMFISAAMFFAARLAQRIELDRSGLYVKDDPNKNRH